MSKKIIQLDVTIGPFVNIRPLTHILYKKGYIELTICKSATFYLMLVKKVRQSGNMESIYSHEFRFDNNFTLWKNIYDQTKRKFLYQKFLNLIIKSCII